MTLALVAVALLLTLAVEFFVVADIDIGRTNTVFKTYLQVWVLLGVAAAVAVGRLYAAPRGAAARARLALARAGFVVLLAATLLYPVLATPAKIHDRFDTTRRPDARRHGVHGAAPSTSTRTSPMRLADDLGAIRWMQEHVQGSPVIAEANTYPTLYGWGNRYAMFTGNPAVDRLGLPPAPAAAGRRATRSRSAIEDVQAAYRRATRARPTGRPRRYGVRYVVVGPLERAYFPDGQQKWQTRGRRTLWDRRVPNPGVPTTPPRPPPGRGGP